MQRLRQASIRSFSFSSTGAPNWTSRTSAVRPRYRWQLEGAAAVAATTGTTTTTTRDRQAATRAPLSCCESWVRKSSAPRTRLDADASWSWCRQVSRLGRASLALLPLTALWSSPASASQTVRRVTFNKDVAPLVYRHCSSCHRPGETAPFSLLTFDDVRRRAHQIVEVTRNRYMPPWKAAIGFGGPFDGERRLTGEEITTLAAWVEQGAI